MYLLDTSTLIDLSKERPRVVAHFAETGSASVYASVISQGELLIGVRRLQRIRPERYPAELDRVTRLLDDVGLLSVTSPIAAAYSQIQAELMSRGRGRLTINDGWIAATALEHQLALVTSDAHLKSLSDIVSIEDWRE